MVLYDNAERMHGMQLIDACTGVVRETAVREMKCREMKFREMEFLHIGAFATQLYQLIMLQKYYDIG